MLGRILGFFSRRAARRAETEAPAPVGRQANWALDLLVPPADKPVPPPADKAPPRPLQDTEPFPPSRFTLLALQNREGSVEHYFHFVLGYVAPLLVHAPEPAPGKTFLIRSCGPLDGKFAELGLESVQQLAKEQWRALFHSKRYETATLSGYDWIEYFDADAFRTLRRTMLARFGVSPTADVEPRVVAINRGRSPEAYKAAGVENATSADERRSIPNMPEVRDAIVAAGYACDLVELEGATLREQLVRFASARIVVAQHGAALVNMIWMQPGGTIVEVLPDMGRAEHVFSKLAEACGHDYVFLKQKMRYAAVDAQAVAACLPRVGVAAPVAGMKSHG